MAGPTPRCPRCASRFMEVEEPREPDPEFDRLFDERWEELFGEPPAPGESSLGVEFRDAALSRTTRDGGAPIYICPRCGELEAIAQSYDRLIPFTEWPLTLERLIEEERAWYIFNRPAKGGDA